MNLPRPSLKNWLVAGLLGLALLGVLHLTVRQQPPAELASQSPLSSPLIRLSSPLIPPTKAPLPVHSLAPAPVPTPTAWPTSQPVQLSDRPSNLALTVLHTNDTWGYLRPCG